MPWTPQDVRDVIFNTVQQALGEEAISNINAQNFVAMGNLILGATGEGINGITDNFVNALNKRIGRTVISYRAYRNKLDDMVLDDFEFGAILQKIKTQMPEEEPDQMYDLTDGESVDHYKVNKLKTKQKLFMAETPFQFHISTPIRLLQEAFLSEDKMAAFIASRFGEVRNRVELSFESQGRLCLNNFMANEPKSFHLITMYNNETGKSLTPKGAKMDADFLRYVLRIMKTYMDDITDLTTINNVEGEERHTPLEDQRIRIISDFLYALETSVYYSAFNDDYLKLRGFKKLNFWQSPEDRYAINLTPATTEGTASPVSQDNIIGIVYDRDALGIYKQEELILTTPINAAGGFYNTYWHYKNLYFNDLSENFAMFILD